MKRGEIWTVSGGKDYAGKPRPVVIVQDDSFSATDSITVCGFTSDPTDAPLFRVQIEPSNLNGLKLSSRLMVDKLTTVHKTKLGKRIGSLSRSDILRMNQSIIVFLGLATSTKMPGDDGD
ncbi:MAG TPA: type II toxin-antitoxin system PemK/MazF family toxin [Ensifer sp.]|nr:type II toxin-antitoxin system PemK/MazF family toxin [Ensifer sp.]